MSYITGILGGTFSWLLNALDWIRVKPSDTPDEAEARALVMWLGAAIAALLFVVFVGVTVGNVFDGPANPGDSFAIVMQPLRETFSFGIAVFELAILLGMGGLLARLWWLARRNGS